MRMINGKAHTQPIYETPQVWKLVCKFKLFKALNENEITTHYIASS